MALSGECVHVSNITALADTLSSVLIFGLYLFKID